MFDPPLEQFSHLAPSSWGREMRDSVYSAADGVACGVDKLLEGHIRRLAARTRTLRPHLAPLSSFFPRFPIVPFRLFSPSLLFSLPPSFRHHGECVHCACALNRSGAHPRIRGLDVFATDPTWEVSTGGCPDGELAFAISYTACAARLMSRAHTSALLIDAEGCAFVQIPSSDPGVSIWSLRTWDAASCKTAT